MKMIYRGFMYEAVNQDNPLLDTLLNLGYVQDHSELSTDFGGNLAFNKEVEGGYNIALDITPTESYLSIYAPSVATGTRNRQIHTKKKISTTAVKITPENASQVTNEAIRSIQAHKSN